METVTKFVEKYASANFKTCSDEAMTHQFNDLIKQCHDHNESVKSKRLSKKGKKEKLANFLHMLVKMKEIAEQKELRWYSEKAHMRSQLEKIEQEINVASAIDGDCECEELRDEVDALVQQNCDLKDSLEEYEQRCKLREQQIACLEDKEARSDEFVLMLKGQLHDANVQLMKKEHCIMTLKSHGTKLNDHCCNQPQICNPSDQEQRDGKWGEEQPVCTADESESTPNQSSSLFTPVSEGRRQGRDILHMNGSSHVQSTTLSIQEKTNLCQILGKFDTNASPISLSNKLEAIVTQYGLNNRDACALLRVWLPSQLCGKLQIPVGTHKGLSAELNSNWGNAGERLRELQRIMGSRDVRGTSALENAKLKLLATSEEQTRSLVRTWAPWALYQQR